MFRAMVWAWKMLAHVSASIRYIWRNITSIASTLVNAIRAGFNKLVSVCEQWSWACIAVYKYLENIFG